MNVASLERQRSLRGARGRRERSPTLEILVVLQLVSYCGILKYETQESFGCCQRCVITGLTRHVSPLQTR